MRVFQHYGLTICVLVAGLIHLLAFVSFDTAGGVAGAGDSGDYSVSLQASTASLAQLVDSWDTAPDVITQSITFTPPSVEAPSLPDQVPARPVAMSAPMTPAMPASPEQPQIPLMTAVVQQPAEPDTTVETEASPRPPQRPAPPVNTVEQASQVASGAGGGATAGAAQPTDSVSQTAASVTNAAQQWAAAIKGQIERAKRYPSNAGGASGSAVVVLTVGNDGRLVGVSVSASSGNRALDRAAVDAVRRAGQFPAAPTGLTNARYSFSLTISFEV